ncbi:hypothetical protein [Neobacillus sp. 19]|uniref:hypothetical protein n=1 Tax=Neobacillus sp. 19 TaxID=3394458 RepID=UPI003BF67516
MNGIKKIEDMEPWAVSTLEWVADNIPAYDYDLDCDLDYDLDYDDLTGSDGARDQGYGDYIVLYMPPFVQDMDQS